MSRAAAPRQPAPRSAAATAPSAMVLSQGVTYAVSDAADPVGKVLAAGKHAQSFVVGRRVVVDLLELAVIAGTNVLLFGPPGTAKTLAVDIFASCIDRSSVFSTMLSKFSKPSEVFGPMDLQAFKAGRLETHTDGYLPSATIGIIDEIFKGSSAILNTLLPLANERRFFDDGKWHATPLRLMVGMSNELPEDAVVLAAIYDRFPLKHWAEYLGESDFAAMLTAPRWSAANPPAAPVTLTEADFKEIGRRMAEVTVPPEVIRSLCDIRRMLAAQKVVASDRRYTQALAIIKASAVRRGCTVAQSDDLRPLRYVLWNEPAQSAVVDQVVAEFVSPMGKAIKEQLHELAAARSKILTAHTSAPGGSGEKLAAATSTAGRVLAGVRNVAARIQEIGKSCTDAERQMCNLSHAAALAFLDSAVALMQGQITYEAFVQRTEHDLTVDFDG